MTDHEHRGEPERIWPDRQERRLFGLAMGAEFHPSARKRADYQARYDAETTPEREATIREHLAEIEQSRREESQRGRELEECLRPRWGEQHTGNWREGTER